MNEKKEEREARDVPEEWKARVSRRGFLTTSSAALASTGVASIGGAALREASAQSTPEALASPEALATPEAAAAHAEMLETEAGAQPIQFFNIHEAATVDALVSRIMPGSADDPGAHEAGVVFFIDKTLHGTNFGYTLKTYTQGPFLVVSEEAEAPVPVGASSIRDIYEFVSVSPDLVSRFGYQSVLTPQEIYRRGLGYVDAYAQDQFGENFIDLSAEEQDQILTAMDEETATGFEGPSAKAFFTQLRNDTIEGMFSDPMYGGNRDLIGWKLIGYPGAQRLYTPDDILDATFTRPPQSLAQLMASEGH